MSLQRNVREKERRMNRLLMASSLMCMDPMNVARDISVMDEHFDLYHVDVMDSHFCPNMALTPQFANTLRKHSSLPMDVHLMVEDPVMFTEMSELGPDDCLSYQAETVERNAFRLLLRSTSWRLRQRRALTSTARTSRSLFASAHDLLGIDERPDVSYRASVGLHSFPGVLVPVHIRFAVWSG